ncbi:MAG TPA: transglutaminase-like domain-containing protein [Clostridia bacterium]|nr:transglutaminase-like domain-containing protein [Clostridia bacterium]
MGKNIKLAAYLTDILCALLLATVVNAALFAQLPLESTLGACFLATALGTALVFLFARKWWVFPAFLLFAAATFALASAFNGEEGAASWGASFISWCFTGFSSLEFDPGESAFFLARLLFALPAAALAFLFYRKVFRFGIVPPVVLVALYLLYRRQGTEQLVAAASLGAPVILISLAKAAGLRIDAPLESGERVFAQFLPAFAVLFTPLIVLGSLFLSPVEDGVWRAERFANLIDDLQDAAEGGSSSYATFKLKDIGFAPLGDRLGGDIQLDDTIVMTVITSFPVRLGGAVYNAYNGKTWYDTGSNSYRFESMVWGSKRRAAFFTDAPSGGDEAKKLYRKMTTDIELTVNYMLKGNTFFSAGQVSRLKNTSSFGSEIYFTSQGEINASRIRRSLYYVLDTTVFGRGTKDFDNNMLLLETLTSHSGDPLYDAVCATYLQLPDTLPESVYETARSITEGQSSPYQKARAIEKWLRENCTYTLTPGTPPEDEDFVAYFLGTRKGYCVYYASAMAVLARCEGLPARFVTGYAIKRNEMYPNSPNSYVATNATAHAWTEVYFKGIGWVVFDPTAWDFQEAVPFTERQEPEQTPHQVAVTPTVEEVQQQPSISHPLTSQEKAALALALILLFLLVLLLFLRMALLLSPAETTYKLLYRKYRGRMPEMLDACYVKLTRQAVFLDLNLHSEDTVTAFARRLDVRYGNKTPSTACKAVTLWHFALKEPTREDVKKLCALNAAIERRIKAELGFFPYLFRCVLIGK